MKKRINSLILTDFYKMGHVHQYPKDTELVYSTITPRSNKYFPEATEVTWFGLQGVLHEMVEDFKVNFFGRKVEDVFAEWNRYQVFCLNVPNPDSRHVEDLHGLGYLPVQIDALPEGTKVPFNVPCATIHNTNRRFAWLTNALETYLSLSLWRASTSATIASYFHLICREAAERTCENFDHLPFQCHDFSMRGHDSVISASQSSAGHLLYFKGTDTVPAIDYLERYYKADISKEIVGVSVPATEHSVMCVGGVDNEFQTYERLITEVYPTGIVSIVSDTWDLWGCIKNIIFPLKEKIMVRDGKVVIRPDSGNPVDIICGDPRAKTPEERMGLIELLSTEFECSANSKGFKVLSDKIGAIYGDGITLARAEEILSKLEMKGFASSNIVFGVGSFSYVYNSRDTLGWAIKSTFCVRGGERIPIFKDPKTDDGTKKSHKGMVLVDRGYDGNLFCEDGYTFYPGGGNSCGAMNTAFRDGDILVDDSLEDIRKRCWR
jgi:nicotinamide phosphoribosyltransferase